MGEATRLSVGLTAAFCFYIISGGMGLAGLFVAWTAERHQGGARHARRAYGLLLTAWAVVAILSGPALLGAA